MPITDAFIRWLENDAEDRVFLFEIDHVIDVVTGVPPLETHTPTTVTKRVSDVGYRTSPSDTPANTSYPGVVRAIPQYTRAIDQKTLGGRGTLSIGAMTIDNADGSYDSWLDLACDGSEVRCYVGAKTWSYTDFVHVFTAATQRIEAPDPTSIVITLKDALALLNASVATEFIGGTGPNQERAKPINLGFVQQAEVLQEDKPSLLYRYGVEGSLVALRDRGLDLAGSYTDNGDGTATLVSEPTGIVTADILTTGGPGNSYRASDMMAKFVDDFLPIDYATQYVGNLTPGTFPGPTSTLYGPGDFEVGFRIESQSNALDILDQLCFTMIAFYTFTREAKFGFGRIWPAMFPFIDPVMTFTADDLRPSTQPKVSHGDPDYWQWYFFYNKNWHTMSQGDFAGGVTSDKIAQFSSKGTYASDKPSRPGIEAVISPDYYDQPSPYHKTMSVSQETETWLSIQPADDSDPDYPLGTRWFRHIRSLHFPWWEFCEIAVGLRAFTLELGDVVLFNFPRYGYDAIDPATGLQGVKFQVVSIDMRLTAGEIGLILFRQRGADVTPPFVHRGDGLAQGVATVSGVGFSPIHSGAGSAAGVATVTAVGTNAGGGGPPDAVVFTSYLSSSPSSWIDNNSLGAPGFTLTGAPAIPTIDITSPPVSFTGDTTDPIPYPDTQMTIIGGVANWPGGVFSVNFTGANPADASLTYDATLKSWNITLPHVYFGTSVTDGSTIGAYQAGASQVIVQVQQGGVNYGPAIHYEPDNIAHSTHGSTQFSDSTGDWAMGYNFIASPPSYGNVSYFVDNIFASAYGPNGPNSQGANWNIQPQIPSDGSSWEAFIGVGPPTTIWQPHGDVIWAITKHDPSAPDLTVVPASSSDTSLPSNIGPWFWKIVPDVADWSSFIGQNTHTIVPTLDGSTPVGSTVSFDVFVADAAIPPYVDPVSTMTVQRQVDVVNSGATAWTLVGGVQQSGLYPDFNGGDDQIILMNGSAEDGDVTVTYLARSPHAGVATFSFSASGSGSGWSYTATQSGNQLIVDVSITGASYDSGVDPFNFTFTVADDLQTLPHTGNYQLQVSS